jgi:lipopolysaccharide/colanic/teichoic acid biosynthesis glycosyltransferase
MQHKININDINLNSEINSSLSKNTFITLKRTIDLLVTILLSPIFIPTLFIGILIVKFGSKGPIFFIQKRVGLNGKVFNIYKLRTMIYNKNQFDLSHTIENDDRIYHAGKFLRYTKIDEIPQFFNILIGDMSLIGPRPEREEIVKILVNKIPNYNLRHLVRPGLSGLAQINNPKATPDQSIEKLQYDLYYIKNVNFQIECKIYFKTLFIVLKLDSL